MSKICMFAAVKTKISNDDHENVFVQSYFLGVLDLDLQISFYSVNIIKTIEIL